MNPLKMTPRRIWIARAIAVVADLLQIVLFPLETFPPVNVAVDVVVAIVMIILLGWHIAFLPSFIVKAVPFGDLAPTWTIAVLVATRQSKSIPK
jgi:dolichyl-phosphate-mannose--protein O-mannosyl transferase